MRVVSDGYFTQFYFRPYEKETWREEFWQNKKFYGMVDDMEVWTYSDSLPFLLKQGLTYSGVVAPSDFYSENQSELLRFLKLCQTENGLKIKGIKNHKHFNLGMDNNMLSTARMVENNDEFKGFGMVDKFNFVYNTKAWSGTLSYFDPKSLIDVDVLSEARVNRAVNTGGVISINGVPTGIQNIHLGKVAPSEGYAIIDKDKGVYIPNNVSDLEGILDQLIIILPQTVTAFLAPPNPTYGTAMTAVVAQLTTLRNSLK